MYQYTPSSPRATHKLSRQQKSKFFFFLTPFQMRHAPFHHDHQSITDPAGHTIRDGRRLHHTFIASFPSEKKGWTGGLLLWTSRVCARIHAYPCLTFRQAKPKGTVVRCGPKKRGFSNEDTKKAQQPHSASVSSHLRGLFSPPGISGPPGSGTMRSYPDPCSDAQVCAPTAQSPRLRFPGGQS